MPRAKVETVESPVPPVAEVKAEKARIQVLERRLQNPFGAPAEEVRFKEPGRKARWFNAAIMADKIWRAKNMGWSVVYPNDLLDIDQIGGYELSPSGGHMVRGDRGQEVLLWMPTSDWHKVQQAKTRINMQSVGTNKLQTDEVAQAAAKQFGPQAGDYVSKSYANVVDQHEIIERTSEGE